MSARMTSPVRIACGRNVMKVARAKRVILSTLDPLPERLVQAIHLTIAFYVRAGVQVEETGDIDDLDSIKLDDEFHEKIEDLLHEVRIPLKLADDDDSTTVILHEDGWARAVFGLEVEFRLVIQTLNGLHQEVDEYEVRITYDIATGRAMFDRDYFRVIMLDGKLNKPPA